MNDANAQSFPSSKALGYTLLELLVVVSIIGIVFTGGFASYREFQRRQNLEAAVRIVRGDLRLAQQYAIAGKKPEESANCVSGTLDGYSFDKVNSTTYEIKAVCNDGGDEYVVKTVDLSSNLSYIQLQSFTPSNELVFKVLGRGTNYASDSEIAVSDTTTGTSKSIFVSPSGEIR